MSGNYKSTEFVASDSDSSGDEAPTKKPVLKKEPKKEKKVEKEVKKDKKHKKDRKEGKRDKEARKDKKEIRKEKPLKSEKRKRELSPASDTPEEDDLPPPKKVEKKTTKGKKEFTKTESSAVDLSSMINIGMKRYVGILEFKGKKYLNIREYYEDSTGSKPGKKGVTLVQDQWENLKDSFFDIDEKMHNASDEDVCPIDLGKNKRVRVTKFKMKYLLIDIRDTYMKDGEERPGSKGIALKPEQYNKIKDMQEEIDEMWKN